MSTRWAVALLSLLVLAACDDPPPPAAPSDEARLEALLAEIKTTERVCQPWRGTSRAEVEATFGEGEPLHHVKSEDLSGTPPPWYSRFRGYTVREDGMLRVHYHEDWRVLDASYAPPGGVTTRFKHIRNPTPEQKAGRLRLRLQSAERRLAQMKRIRAAYRALPPLPDRRSEERLENLSGHAERIETRCVPDPGTGRAEVESTFGEGRPLHGTDRKARRPPPRADSRRRGYQVCEDGTLAVRYDDDWKVERAGYFATREALKGRVILGPNATREQRAEEQRQDLRNAELRLEQMKRVREAYEKLPPLPKPTMEERLDLVSAEAERLEKACAPKPGTPRPEIEKRFGEGWPRHAVQPAKRERRDPAPANSPCRWYVICPDGVLWVWYDEAWNVERARFRQPRGTTMGTLFLSENSPPEVKARILATYLRNAEYRLEQMKRVQAALAVR